MARIIEWLTLEKPVQAIVTVRELAVKCEQWTMHLHRVLDLVGISTIMHLMVTHPADATTWCSEAQRQAALDLAVDALQIETVIFQTSSLHDQELSWMLKSLCSRGIMAGSLLLEDDHAAAVDKNRQHLTTVIDSLTSAKTVIFFRDSLAPIEWDLVVDVTRSPGVHWLLPAATEVPVEKMRLDSLFFLYRCGDDDQASSVFVDEIYSIKGEIPVRNLWLQGAMSQPDGSSDAISRTRDSERFMWKRRSDLRGVRLVNSVLPVMYFNQRVEDDGQGGSPYKGLFQDILDLLKTALNFSVGGRRSSKLSP